MSNTEKVISEFLSVGENEFTLLRMAEEIGRLRVENDRIRTEARVEINWLYQRAERAERILAALREPSIVVVDAATEVLADCRARCHAGAAWDAPYFAIRAAVAAAERGVEE